ncbi:8-oxo-dGTP diphosphatase [Candidatus Dojkabacteria bacterium]|uniref:8-oxo-dGTP diphosphatase n=1 Tax=Candidatus Dojkabacteria bacterium TaxID=2099670 RepID=A0A955RLG0_9BACT|nr:8-oxo-dGTP diphosphatase [Candidatus Dojkabacteria bacterium]
MKIGVLCYICRGDEVLLLHRNKKEKDVHQGKWIGVGGKLEPGESPEQTVVREVKEETGLEVKSMRFAGMFTAPKTDNEHDDDWYGFVFRVDEFSGELIEECPEGDLEWVHKDKFDDLPMWAGDRNMLTWIHNEGFFSYLVACDTTNTLTLDRVSWY